MKQLMRYRFDAGHSLFLSRLHAKSLFPHYCQNTGYDLIERVYVLFFFACNTQTHTQNQRINVGQANK